MIQMLKFIFWFSLITIFYTYIGYPILITIFGKMRLLRRRGVYPERSEWCPRNDWEYPILSIIISVFNEEAVIQQKIENCLNLDYPKDKLEILIGSDGSTDRTNTILSRYEGRFGNLRIFMAKERKGKPYTINKLVEASGSEILFFTDARQIIERNALIKLVRNFRDEKIGCVSGGLIYRKKDSITGRGIGAYWKYEKYLREMESNIYSMIGATGAIYACRRALFVLLPQNMILDDMYIPLKVVEKGYRAIFEREANAYDIFAEIPRDEHKRKIRTLSGNYQIFFQLPHMLNPFKSKLAIQIISHKLLRVLVPFFMVTLFLSNLFLLREKPYNIFIIAQTMFYVIALIEGAFRKRITKIFGIPYLFCLLNFSALVGFWEFVRNGTDVKWEKARS